MNIRLPAALKKRLEAAAARNQRSFKAEIVACLEEKFPPPNFSIDDFVDEFITPIRLAPTIAEKIRLATIANQHLKQHAEAQGIAVLVEDDEEWGARVVLGFMRPPAET